MSVSEAVAIGQLLRRQEERAQILGTRKHVLEELLKETEANLDAVQENVAFLKIGLRGNAGK